MKRKLSVREKRLLILLLLIAFGAGYFKYLYLPLKIDNETLKLDNQSLKTQEANISQLIMTKDELLYKIQELKAVSRQLTKELPPYVAEEYMIMDFLDSIYANNIDVSSISFSNSGQNAKANETVESVDDVLLLYEQSINNRNQKISALKDIVAMNKNESGQSKQDEEGKDIKSDENVTSALVMTVSLQGTYENMKSLIKDLNEFESMIIIRNVSFQRGERESKLVNTGMQLEFPYFDDNSKYDLEEWDSLPLRPIEKDPFDEYNPKPITKKMPRVKKQDKDKIEEKLIVETKKTPTIANNLVDFYITATTFNKQNFAFNIGKKGDRFYRLSSDRVDEILELYITEVEGKLSFAIGSIERPLTKNTRLVNFKPESDVINVKLVSSPRLGDDDIAIAKLKILNDSNVKVVVYIEDEDMVSPRVEIVKQGDVVIKN